MPRANPDGRGSMNLYNKGELDYALIKVPGQSCLVTPYWEDYRWWLPINRDNPQALDTFHTQLEVIQRPGIWSSPGTYPEWLSSLGIDSSHIVDDEASMLKTPCDFVWARAHKNAWCPYPGGYMQAYRHKPWYTKETRHRKAEQMSGYFLCFSDMDDWLMTASVSTQEESDEIWKYISTVPDLTYSDLYDIGMRA